MSLVQGHAVDPFDGKCWLSISGQLFPVVITRFEQDQDELDIRSMNSGEERVAVRGLMGYTFTMRNTGKPEDRPVGMAIMTTDPKVLDAVKATLTVMGHRDSWKELT